METKINFKEAEGRCKILGDRIRSKERVLYESLADYESYEVIRDEIERSLKCLQNISVEKDYFVGKPVEAISTFFPLNLPLYSTILFAIIPSFFSEKLYLRPPVLMRDTIERVFKILELDSLFPDIKKSEVERNDFISSYVLKSNVVIFTGTYENAMDLREKLPDHILFLYNGAGNNPIIVTESADIDLAVTKTIDVKLFNSGQDCAGPDSILVQSKISEKFIQKMLGNLKNIGVGDYRDNKVRVGKLIDQKHLFFTGKILSKYRSHIVQGGVIDYSKGIVYPTVIVTEIEQEKNYLEFFAPIFYVTLYRNDRDLSLYFNDPSYLDHAMYVSIFGDSEYSQTIAGSTVLYNQTILDVEDGNKEFGGYGRKSSFVAIGKKIISRPVLVSKEIHNFLSSQG